MKLSEAMRKGYALIGCQTFGHYFDYAREIDENGQHRIIAACALGCAYLGLHPEAIAAGPTSLTVSDALVAEFPRDHRDGTLNLAALMNDKQDRSVPEIAAWLESIGA